MIYNFYIADEFLEEVKTHIIRELPSASFNNTPFYIDRKWYLSINIDQNDYGKLGSYLSSLTNDKKYIKKPFFLYRILSIFT